ncbi:MAG: FprA family A-type flavoprotein [Candidatus Izimaplasma sp.]|nr:FprA family A-type flavoprotein [Candidatus Izimaplasma bacterium]
MFKKQIEKGIYLLSMSVEDMMFESMWALPHGVTMNSYIVKGEKTAIIDGVIGWDGVPKTLYDSLGEIDIDPSKIDYLIVNHMEPDHSGWIEDFKEINNHFKLVTTQKGVPMVRSFYGDDIDVVVVDEGDSIDLGNGKVLTFHPIPNVHWPETMLTLEKSTKTLFSCDMYGAFGTLKDAYFDDEIRKEDVSFFEKEAIRYFSNVLTTFSPMVKRAITKTRSLDVAMIAPGHGPLYRDNPNQIIDDYERFTQYANGFGKNAVTIIWGSMYGSTKKAVKYTEKVLNEVGVTVHSVHMPYTSISEMVTNVFQSAGVIIAASTYEYKMFPPVAHAIDELGRKKITNKHAFYFGSFAWNEGATRDLHTIIDNYRMKWRFIEDKTFEGTPKEDVLETIKKHVLELTKVMQDNVI